MASLKLLRGAPRGTGANLALDRQTRAVIAAAGSR
jgi:hypothetical protein